MPREKVKYRNLIIAFIAAAAIFSSGLFLGEKITSFKIQEVGQVQEDLKNSLASLELRYKLLEANVCEFSSFNEFGEELDELGNRIANIEAGYDKDDPRVLSLKEPYFLLEIRHYLLLKEAKEKCGSDYDLVLYFYSNDEEQCKDCDNQGYILGYLQKKIGYDKIKVYSFDVRSDSPSVQTLRDIHDIRQVPSIAVNEETYEGFLTLEEIERILEKT